MDNRLLLMLSYVTALRGDLLEDDKKALRSLLDDWRKVYDQYDINTSHSSISDVVYKYDGITRNHCPNNRENSILAKTVERLLAEKSKRD